MAFQTMFVWILQITLWSPVLVSLADSKLLDFSDPGQLTLCIQWNPSKADTNGTNDFIRCSEVSLAQRLVVDHAPHTIAASYDKALLWTTKKTVLMSNLSTDSSYKQEFETY